MSHGQFVTFGSPWREDERSRFYREQQEREREASHVGRAAQWFALNLVGLPLHSEQQTLDLCRELAETRYGADRVAAMGEVIRKASELVWSGTVERATPDPLPVAEVIAAPRTVIYRAA